MHRLCRRVNDLYQARVWCGPDLFANLGLYKTAWAANRVAKAAIRAANPVNPLTLWRAAKSLPPHFDVPAGLLPMYVFPIDGGLAYGARQSKHPDAVVLRAFADPESAYLAMVRHLRRQRLPR